MESYKFRIPVGDWSNDGHGRCEYISISSNKNKTAILAAHTAAQKVYPALDPLELCSLSDETYFDDETIESLKVVGAPLPEDCGYVEPLELVDLLCWYLNVGDPGLDCKIVDDSDGTLVELSCGYGLFS